MAQPNHRKIVQALNYLAEKQPDKRLNRMKALKLLWLADRYHLRQYGRTISEDTYYAIKYGPISTTAKDILDSPFIYEDADRCLEAIGKYGYKSIFPTNTDVFSQTDLLALDLIWNKYGKFSEFRLSEMSHKFPEWAKFGDSTKHRRHAMNIMDFFINYNDDSGLFEDAPDFLEVSKEIYLLNN